MTTTEPPASLGATSLSQPLYGASLGAAFTRFFRKYATFSGRASRSEFWWWFLISIIVEAIFYIIGTVAGGIYGSTVDGQLTLGPGYGIYETLAIIYALAVIVPTLALVWRRLHDTNRSGGFYFLGLIPFVGGIIVLVFFLLGPNPAGARFDK